MKKKVTFSNKRAMLIFGMIGLLLGAVLAGALLNVRPASAQQGAITADDAKAAAEGAYPGATAVEVELDNGVEVIIDATTGEISATEMEDGDGAEEDD